MEDFRNEYNKKTKGNVFVVSLTIFSILSLIVSSISLYKVSNISAKNNTLTSDIGIKIADTSGSSSENVTTGNGVVDVASTMKNKVVSIMVYGKATSSFSNSVTYTQISSGSGFIITEDGYVVTNNHVIENGTTFKIKIADQDTEYEAKKVGSDTVSDLAVLKIESDQKFESVVMGNSDNVQVGELAVAIGNPLGSQLNNSVTVGYISAKDREISSGSVTSKMIQTDAAINPGNSGGPLVNVNGEVIGINTMKSTFAGYDSYGNAVSADGIGFAIPISDAIPIIQEIVKSGTYKRPGIGITYYIIDSETSDKGNIPEGLLVSKIYTDSPASKAGMQVDDIIIKADGTDIKNSSDLNTILKTKAIGDKLNITVVRNGENIEIELTLVDLNEIQTQETSQSSDSQNNKWSWPFE